jgi:sporulation protein YlmC with PRC-barrel domain
MYMDKMKHRRLQELDQSDFEIIKGEPDIRGWDVRNSRGQKIGEVEELIIDAQQKKVRYMIVDLDDNELKLTHRKVILPIGLAELHKDDDDVILPNVDAEKLNALPAYERNNLTPKTEQAICTTLGRQTGTASMLEGEELHPDFYRHDYYNDDNLYKHRLHEVKSGEQQRRESEYEKGLQLWELRSEGGVLPDRERNRSEHRTEKEEEARMEMVHNRRKQYEDHRRSQTEERSHSHDDDQPRRKHNSIIARTRDEGLQDG